MWGTEPTALKILSNRNRQKSFAVGVYSEGGENATKA